MKRRDGSEKQIKKIYLIALKTVAVNPQKFMSSYAMSEEYQTVGQGIVAWFCQRASAGRG